MLGARALSVGAASTCVTDEVSSVGVSESFVVSLLGPESAGAEVLEGVATTAALSLVALCAEVDLSDFREHEAAPSVSRSAANVTAPSRRVIALSCKSIPERQNIRYSLAMHNRCPARYPQARAHLACSRRNLHSRDVAGTIDNAFYQ
jgi:hypothetical protein